MDKEGDKSTEAEGEAFRVDFKTTVLERYGSEIFRPVCTSFFRKKDDVGFIDRAKISTKGIEVIEGLEQLRFDEVPILFIEGRTEAIRTRTGVVVHGEEGSPDLIKGERVGKGCSLSGIQGCGGDKGGKVNDIGRGKWNTKQLPEEVVENSGFSSVGENRRAIIIIQEFDLVFP
jgi:hypothetical protein